MDFKKYGVVYILIFLVVSLFVVSRIFPGAKIFNLTPTIAPVSQPSESPKPSGLKVIINYGDKTVSTDDIKAENAYGALVEFTKREKLDLKTKTYDFGVFVESIGGFANIKDKSWIYYVNDKSGDVAADKKIINIGDKVEWKYEKPNY